MSEKKDYKATNRFLIKPILNPSEAERFVTRALKVGIEHESIDQRVLHDTIYHYTVMYLKLKTIHDNKLEREYCK